MKKTVQLFVAVAAFTLLLASCSMEKRVYMSGYHIEKHNGVKSVATSAPAPLKQQVPATTVQENNEIAMPIPAADNAQQKAGNNIIASTEKTPVNTKRSETNKAVEKAIVKQLLKKAELNKLEKKSKKPFSSDDDTVLLYILCFFIPPVAVGLATDWDLKPVIINCLWCVLCGIPGIIHALIIVSRNR